MAQPGERGTRSGTAPHAEDCDSLDCPCYANGQYDVLMALRVLEQLGMTEARERLLAASHSGSFEVES